MPRLQWNIRIRQPPPLSPLPSRKAPQNSLILTWSTSEWAVRKIKNNFLESRINVLDLPLLVKVHGTTLCTTFVMWDIIWSKYNKTLFSKSKTVFIHRKRSSKPLEKKVWLSVRVYVQFYNNKRVLWFGSLCQESQSSRVRFEK